jgi:prolyl-tRNA editing enzyme YbaK/EbsC (Cys-tRNA(Pro) deacylase)
MNYHPTVEMIKNLLKDKEIDFEVFEHEPVRTSEEASKLRNGYSIEQGAKSIIARVKEAGKGKRFAMFVLQGNRKFDKQKIKNNLGLTDIRFATEEEVSEITNGIVPGGVPPFGNLFGLDVFVDKELLKNEKIIFNAGDRGYSIGIRSEDYVKAVQPIIEDIIIDLE